MDVTRTHWEGEDFEMLSWHDCSIFGVSFEIGDDRSDLVLDLDFIAEWVCGVGGLARFKVAPAVLTFHHVTDTSIRIEPFGGGHQVALFPPVISQIYRERIGEQRVCLDRPYYAWRIELVAPGGAISFGASGFTQDLVGEPVLLETQNLRGRR
jgi:hypothetical protein